jgi:quercetin 2,3-dioxygenase
MKTASHITRSVPALEGAGVKLHRAFGFHDTTLTDPFLLLDDFRGDDPEDYMAGFPWHPHRGIETITYMLEGSVEHGDSMGNSGVIGAGDVQWMTAGSGIIHQEMPKQGKSGKMGGFQLWANLPAKEKMCAPKYRGVTAKDIPSARLKNGVSVKIICGSAEGVKGPVHDITIQPEYLDISVPADKTFKRDFKDGINVIAYVFEGSGELCGEKVDNRNLVIFSGEGGIEAKAGEKGVRFLLISGMPLKEPVAWYGPIVMNTQEELETAFDEYENGTFLKHAK